MPPIQAKTLIKLGANVAVLDVEGKTPLHWAVSRYVALSF